jgi:hypothetical protein
VILNHIPIFLILFPFLWVGVLLLLVCIIGRGLGVCEDKASWVIRKGKTTLRARSSASTISSAMLEALISVCSLQVLHLVGIVVHLSASATAIIIVT